MATEVGNKLGYIAVSSPSRIYNKETKRLQALNSILLNYMPCSLTSAIHICKFTNKEETSGKLFNIFIAFSTNYLAIILN